jgi:hypothetical protein
MGGVKNALNRFRERYFFHYLLFDYYKFFNCSFLSSFMFHFFTFEFLLNFFCYVSLGC